MNSDTDRILTVTQDCDERGHCADHPILLSITKRNHETTTRVATKLDRMSDGLYGTPENPDSGFIHTTLAFFNEVRQDRIDTGKRMAGYDALATLVKKRVNLMTVAVVSGAGSIIIAALSPVVAHYVSTIIGVTK